MKLVVLEPNGAQTAAMPEPDIADIFYRAHGDKRVPLERDVQTGQTKFRLEVY